MGEHAPDPIIIYGAPRSGTTYLRTILCEHPDVLITHETRVFVWAHRALNVLTRDDQYLLSHRDEFVDLLREDVRALIRRFYDQRAPGKFFWGDKNPHYAAPRHAGCLDTIVDLFPGAKFLHIIRDGRDVAASLVQKGWVDFETAHDVWRGHIDLGREFGSKLPEWQYHELRYEELIADDVAAAERVAAFLGLEFDPAMRAYCERQASERTPLSGPTRTLSATSVGESQWASLFTEAEQRRSLELIGPTLARYGYTP